MTTMDKFESHFNRHDQPNAEGSASSASPPKIKEKTVKLRIDDIAFANAVSAELAAKGVIVEIPKVVRGMLHVLHGMLSPQIIAAIMTGPSRSRGDIDADAAGRMVYAQLRAAGVTDAEIAAPPPDPPTPPRDIKSEIREGVIAAVRTQHPKPVVGTVLDIIGMFSVNGATRPELANVLKQMMRDASCAVAVEPYPKQSVPTAGTYRLYVLSMRQSHRGAKRNG